VKKTTFLWLALSFLAFPLALKAQIRQVEGRALWAHPVDFGKSEAEVEEFFKQLKKCKIQLLVPLVKDTSGLIYWHSQKFSSAIHPDYRNFDLLKAITDVAKKYRIKVHAWLCDFPEGKDSPAFKLHPEWAMVNPQGQLTSDEQLTSDQAYDAVWMCPARRPGYTDQWLLPMIDEIVAQYPVDGIHHDYVRYPGDVAPDSYCFCDYCLENYLAYNLLFYPSRPQDQFLLKKTRLREESNWDLGLTAKPADWPRMTREEKSKFLLEGRTVNRNDMDYFFYETRSDAISQFVREAWERASEVRPEIEFSAAVFSNPMLSGRFIGQRWTDFAPWLDIAMPMNYRSHFQGDFEDFLVYLADTVRAQNKWAESKCNLFAGLDVAYIFKEERKPWQSALDLLKLDGLAASSGDLRKTMKANIAYLKMFSTQKAEDLDKKFTAYQKNEIPKQALIDELNRVLADPPAGFFPEAKL